MKKLLFLFTMLTFMVACSDDDKNDTPINGLEIPEFENPVTPGQTVTIKGEGFDEGSEIWFRAIATRATDNDDVKAEVTGVDANGITFIAPSVYGNQSILLKQDGREYKLGEMLFADQPEEPADVEILPRKIKKFTKVDSEGHSYNESEEFEYDADGRIKSQDFDDGEIWHYTYSNNMITCRQEANEEYEGKSEFILENGRIKSYSLKNDDWYQNYEFEYDKDGYLNESVMTDDEDDTETETFSFVEGNLVKYTFAYKVFKEWNGSIEFIYGEQLNNLNIDLFYIIGEYHFDSNIGDAFLFGMLGKRSRYLPSKMIITDPMWDDDDENISYYKTYTVNIEYEMNGEYISSFTVKAEDGDVEDDYYGTSTFVIEYED